MVNAECTASSLYLVYISISFQKMLAIVIASIDQRKIENVYSILGLYIMSYERALWNVSLPEAQRWCSHGYLILHILVRNPCIVIVDIVYHIEVEPELAHVFGWKIIPRNRAHELVPRFGLIHQ